MTIHPCGTARPKDFHGLLGTVAFGPDQDKLAVVIECHGVGMDQFRWHVMIGKMGRKSLRYCVLRVLVKLRLSLAFGTAAPYHWRAIARRKNCPAAAARLFPYDSLVVNSVLKSRTSQSFDGLVQVPGVVEYANYGFHCLIRSEANYATFIPT
jgi:hypothetical protein